MYKIYFLFAWVVVLCSCSNDEAVIYLVTTPNGSNIATAKSTLLAGENFGPKGKFGYLTDVFLVGEKIVVKDSKNKNVFHVINNGEDLDYSFQELGDGPTAIDNPEFVKVTGHDEQSNDLLLFSYKTKRLSRLGIHRDSILTKIHDVPGEHWAEVQSACLVNDSTIALTGLFPDTKFYLVDRISGETIVKADNENHFGGVFSEEELVAMSPRNLHYNNKHELIVLQNTRINGLYVYDLKGKPHKFYSFGELENLTSEGKFVTDYFYYYSTKTQGDLIYSLYLGLDRKQLTLQEMAVNFIDPELHIYNIVSDELQRFKLDRTVNVCVVNDDQTFIYCIDEDNEDQPLVKYEIPE